MGTAVVLALAVVGGGAAMAVGYFLAWRGRGKLIAEIKARHSAERHSDALNIKLLAAQEEIRQLEILRDAKHPDPILLAWMGVALDMLPKPATHLIRAGVKSGIMPPDPSQGDPGAGAGDAGEALPKTAADSLITELS